jgi:hypothetical protein
LKFLISKSVRALFPKKITVTGNGGKEFRIAFLGTKFKSLQPAPREERGGEEQDDYFVKQLLHV